MVGVDQLDQHLVLAGRQPGYVDGVVVTRIRPQPGQVVDGYLQCPTRGDTLRAPGPNTGAMRTFSTRYWAQKMPWASPSGSGGSTISLGAGSFSMARYGVGPRTSLALWAKALAPSRVPAATAASVLMIWSLHLSRRSDFHRVSASCRGHQPNWFARLTENSLRR